MADLVSVTRSWVRAMREASTEDTDRDRKHTRHHGLGVAFEREKQNVPEGEIIGVTRNG